ncbi:MAG: Ribosomal protein L11 methyltransferase (EC [uncultured Sulfurovum sp.]|uniref:Ribosomal protein L11 methyltransferase n=1 Tax=uncultured Sulfurovum sp. TaxID=269237 RepID=A0A6S6TVS9_9BACT|nr:MAG: Ribosomal protein L11 methyltransferase (EC [uncultured Sulfurovum sp.]
MQSKYYELTMHIKEADFVEFIADFVANISGDGLEIGRNNIIVRSESDLSPIEEAVRTLISTLGGAIAIEYKMEEKENKDWIASYQNSIEPIEAGKFYIYPSWYEAKEGKINIKIDPALAFGSGHHATTFSCLDVIGTRVHKGQRVLDVGCGSGILGLAARKLGAKVELCDTDPISVDSCDKNFELNSAEYEELWEGSANQAQGEYDVVIANIIADVLKFIVHDLTRATRKDGILILSGILDKKEAQVSEVYAGLELLERKQKDEWVTLVYKKLD